MSGCTGCVHWRGLNGDKDRRKACHYLLDTGRMRDCEAGSKCTKRARKMRKRVFGSKKMEEISVSDGEGMAETRP